MCTALPFFALELFAAVFLYFFTGYAVGFLRSERRVVVGRPTRFSVVISLLILPFIIDPNNARLHSPEFEIRLPVELGIRSQGSIPSLLAKWNFVFQG